MLCILKRSFLMLTAFIKLQGYEVEAQTTQHSNTQAIFYLL